MAVNTQFQVRRGTAAQWTSANPTLAAGEIGFESDTNKFKIGSGSTAWASLSYAALQSSDIAELSQDAIDSALTAGTGITKTYNDAANTLTLAVDTSTIATKTYADSAVSTGVAALVASAPSTLDTLNELAAALGNDANYASTITTALGLKAPLSGPTFTGTVVLPSTTSIGTVSSTEIGYVDGVTSAIQTQLDAKLATSTAASTYAPLSSPSLTTPSLGVATATSINSTTIPSSKTLVVTTDKLSVHAATSSSELAGIISDETGTGSLVFGTAPSMSSPVITGTSSITQILEKTTISATAANTTVTYDLLTNGGVLYYTSNASANWTFNVRGDGSNTLNSLMAIGQSVTMAFLVTNGATAYYQTALQVDGNAVTPKWQGGTTPTSGNTSSIDIYTITLIKTANATFTALCGQTKFA
jgi:hypothetical protein